MSQAWPEIVQAVAGRYASRVHRGFVAGKLRHDPVYAALWSSRELQDARSVLDLGCGRGILLALLAERARRYGNRVQLRGVEARASHAEVARAALGTDAHVEVGDVVTAEILGNDAVLLIDVLHYLPEQAHAPVLERIARSLAPGGVLLVREIDREGGVRARLAMAAEHAMSTFRGEPGRAFAFRGARDWRRDLTAAGLTVEERPADQGTPFSNVLLVARKSPQETRPAAILPTSR